MSEKVNGRAENGQFAPGNAGGPGNPFARRTAALRRAALESASERDVAEVMAALKLRAKAGDVAAARLWLAYALGRPGPAPDPDTLDAHELEVRRQSVATAEDTKALFDGVPASLMCELAGAAAPHVQGQMRRTLAEGLRRPDEAEKKGPPEPPGACPAPAPDANGRDRAGPAYAAMLRRVREGLPGGAESILVGRAESSRPDGRGEGRHAHPAGLASGLEDSARPTGGAGCLPGIAPEGAERGSDPRPAPASCFYR